MDKILMEKILIVEDDQAVQKALKRLFESAGYAVEITGDGDLRWRLSARPLRLPLSWTYVCLSYQEKTFVS